MAILGNAVYSQSGLAHHHPTALPVQRHLFVPVPGRYVRKSLALHYVPHPHLVPVLALYLDVDPAPHCRLEYRAHDNVGDVGLRVPLRGDLASILYVLHAAAELLDQLPDVIARLDLDDRIFAHAVSRDTKLDDSTWGPS